MKSKTFSKIVIISVGCVLLSISAFIIYIDPFFHYHKPIEGLTYPLYSERYQNDGIVRHFDYNAIITGTSMTENFKTSECNDLFGVEAIKVPFSGAYLSEIEANLRRAFQQNGNIKVVIRSLEWENLIYGKDEWNGMYTYPYYLYDNYVINDAPYLFNKTAFINSVGRFLKFQSDTAFTFDDYEYWSDRFDYGKSAVLKNRKRPEVVVEKMFLSEEEKRCVIENMECNILDIVKENPSTTFYIFFPPYSVVYWDTIQREGKMDYMLELQKMAIEAMLPYENVKIYSFCNKEDWVTDLDNYIDARHYGGKINSRILRYMVCEECEYHLTKDNYMNYIREIERLYSEYDYDQLYE